MGFALQGFIPFTKPSATHRRRNTLLPFLPPAALLWCLGQNTFRRMTRHPRQDSTSHHYRLQGLRPRENQPPRCATKLNNDKTTDLPLLGFHLLMVLTFITVQNLRSATATLQRPRVCCQIQNFLRSAAYPPIKAAALSRDRPAIPRFLAFA
jgi:hypothetical protein